MKTKSCPLLAFGVCQCLSGIPILCFCALYAFEKFLYQGVDLFNEFTALWAVLVLAGCAQSAAGFLLAMRRMSRSEAGCRLQNAALKTSILLLVVGVMMSMYYGAAVCFGSNDMFGGIPVVIGLCAAFLGATGALIARQVLRMLQDARDCFV